MSVVETERTGKIKDFYDDETGVILEDNTGKEFDFVQPGAMVNFNRGDGVIFITITTPSGRVITKSVIRKN